MYLSQVKALLKATEEDSRGGALTLRRRASDANLGGVYRLAIRDTNCDITLVQPSLAQGFSPSSVGLGNVGDSSRLHFGSDTERDLPSERGCVDG